MKLSKLWVAACLLGCGTGGAPESGLGPELAGDAVVEVESDAGQLAPDAGELGTPDSGEVIEVDAGSEISTNVDAGSDAGGVDAEATPSLDAGALDAGADAGNVATDASTVDTDAGTEAAADAGVEVTSDAGPELVMDSGAVPSSCKAEVCDGMDNDCDGAIDNGLAETFYRDSDNDGFGDVRSPFLGCYTGFGVMHETEAGSVELMDGGFSREANDCDDDNEIRYPGAREVCGSDTDCDGVAPLTSCEGRFALMNVTSCAIQKDDTVACWGRRARGALGDGGSTEYTFEVASEPIAVGRVVAATRLDGGNAHACALSSGYAYCWGYNASGQLGIGSTESVSTPVPVATLPDVMDLALGSDFTCAVTTLNRLYCWGHNDEGQLGDRGAGDTLVPRRVRAPELAEVSAGSHHACGRTPFGEVYCWGRSDEGQIAQTADVDPRFAVKVEGLSDVRRIALGGWHSCAVQRSGHVRCWGDNSYGQLGNGTTVSSVDPVEVVGIEDATAIASSGQATCVVRLDGTVACWGRNESGELGQGHRLDSSVPVAVTALQHVEAVAMNGAVCALRADGSTSCWGYNDYGQVGNGTTETVLSPVEVNITGE